MKKLIIILFIILGIKANAQDTIEKNIGEFSTVKVYDLINLKLIKSHENKVVISGKNKRDVEVLNKNGKLKIRMSLEESYDGEDTVVVLYYTTVDVIDANEGAQVEVKEPIKQYEIELKTQEGAEITANVNTTYATFRAVTGGIINMTGSSKNQDITIFTGGVFHGKEFITERSEVRINAAGEAYINAKRLAKVKVKVGGDVYIYGNPKEIDETSVLGGTIKRM